MNTKQAALGQALTTITEPPAAPPKAKRPKSKAENPPDKFTQRVASLHGRAPQNRLVDQPPVDGKRRREASMVGAVRHHRVRLPCDRPPTCDRDRGSAHTVRSGVGLERT